MSAVPTNSELPGARNGDPVRVLFVMSHPTVSPAISVHLDLIRCFDPARVEAHVAYNRLADRAPNTSSDSSLSQQLRGIPMAGMRAVDFGPLGSTEHREQLAAAMRAGSDLARTAVYARRRRINLIHCEEGTRNGFYALLISRMIGAKCLMHFHLRYGDWMPRASRYAAHHADAIISVSDWTAGTLTGGGVPADRIVTVLNGIDPSEWNPQEVDGAEVRVELGIEPDAPLVAMIAQLIAWKRQHILIEAFRQVADRHPGTRLLIVGKGRDSGPDASYPDRLQRLVRDLNLTENVIFTGRRRDVAEILAAADIVALPSVGDPCPLAVIEALAMATPVVAVRDGGPPELIADGVHGLLSEPDDPVALADNIVALLDDPARRADMGRRGRERVLAQLNRRRMTTEVEAVYRALLGHGTPGPQAVPAAI